MLIKLNNLFRNSYSIIVIMLTDYTYYSQKYSWFNVHDITNSYLIFANNFVVIYFIYAFTQISLYLS